MVGYSLGSKDAENEIEVLGEAESNSVTFSKSLFIDLNITSESILCQHKLVVPYSIINTAKKAREKNVREVIFNANREAADESNVRMTLNLWGFESFIEYIFTVSELVFLEGLIPILNIAELNLREMNHISSIIALLAIPLKIDSEAGIPLSESQSKMIEWAGRLNLPLILHFPIDALKPTIIKQTFKKLVAFQEQYRHIHECIIYQKNPFDQSLKTPIKGNINQLFQTIKNIQAIVEDKITITVPIHHYPPYITQLLELGIKDFPHIPQELPSSITGDNTFSLELLSKKAALMEYQLLNRFPLSFKFIQAGKYSSKLGQVFDSYQYKIKKFNQEKTKGKR